MTDEEPMLEEGSYYCPECGKKTKHEYLQAIPAIFYESSSDDEIARLERETPELLTCIICAADVPSEEE
jgi:hypothetical protein